MDDRKQEPPESGEGMGQPWDRREGESARAYEVFAAYLDLGVGRSLAKTCQNHAKTIPTLKEWSAKHDWVARARAYDDHLAEQQRRQAEAEHLGRITTYRERAARVGSTTADVSLAFLMAAGKRLQVMMMEPDDPRRNGRRETVADIPIKALPGFLRAAAAVAQISLSIEAEALGVRELEQRLTDAADQDSEEDSETGH